jgi:CheY-like chemotaxis protein
MPAKKTTIVAADDEPQLLRLVTRNLQVDGDEVRAVGDGQAALQPIEAHTPELALLDSMMPPHGWLHAHAAGARVLLRPHHAPDGAWTGAGYHSRPRLGRR